MPSVLDLNVYKAGTGVPLIMLHGWNRSLHDLKPLGELLAGIAEVHIIDLPGFGKTPAPPLEGWDTKQYAALIEKYLKENDIMEAVFLGHSFGGRVSLRIAASSPSLVSRLILVDSHGLRPVRSSYQNIRVFCIKKFAKIVKCIDSVCKTSLYKEKFAKRFGSSDYQNAGVLKNTFVKTISENQEAEVGNIKVPTLLLWGSLDTETPVAMAKRFEGLLENSKLIVMEGKDHSPFHGIGSHLCANYIMNFLADNEK